MTKKYATKQFKQFLPMIEKATWYYSKKYHLDRAEIEGQSFLIFCEALETWDKTISTFSTYLTNELQRLEHYCKKEYRNKYKDVLRVKECHKKGYGKNVYLDRYEYIDQYEKTNLFSYDIFDKVITKMDYEISLSDDAKIIVEYILSREWEDVEINWKPRFSFIQKKYVSEGWTQNRIKMAWQEIREWWQGSNKDQFCLGV